MRAKTVGLVFTMLMALQAVIPAWLWAAGGKANDLVVVADTRLVQSGLLRYLADVYNTNPTLMATWAVVLTAVYGCILGFGMDFIMSRTGLDLSSRKIVEH